MVEIALALEMRRMTRQELERSWDEAEKRSGSALWILYSAGTASCALIGLAGLSLLAFSALRIIGAAAVVIAGAGYATIRLAEWRLWRRWLRVSGMICPACGHVLSAHTGTYLKPPRPGLCTVCAENGPCRRTRETGRCDRRGATIFAPPATATR